MTKNSNSNINIFADCDDPRLNVEERTNWRASLVPAAAVIPAPIAYIKFVAVKKLVVELIVS